MEMCILTYMLLSSILRQWIHDRVERDHLVVWTTWHIVISIRHARHIYLFAFGTDLTAEPRGILPKQSSKAAVGIRGS